MECSTDAEVLETFFAIILKGSSLRSEIAPMRH